MNWARAVTRNVGKVASRWTPTPIACHSRRLLYYPIPKVGSSTIRTLIAQADELRYEERPQDARFDRVSPDAVNVRGYRSLTAVRSPWSRLASCYRQKISEARELGHPLFLGFERYNHVLRRRVFWQEMTFDQFVSAVARVPDRLADEHFRSQFRQLPVRRGSVSLDVVLRVDDATSFSEELSRMFGVEVPRVNATGTGGGWRDMYSPESCDLVGCRYRTDVKLLGYDPPLHATPPAGSTYPTQRSQKPWPLA